MPTTEDKIKEIEAEIARTQVNKRTMSHLCSLRARLAKFRAEAMAESSRSSGGPQISTGFEVSKSGSDATVGLLGFPSVGKSSLLNVITTTESEVHEREFTTLTAIPGNMEYNGAKIQIVDLPGIIEAAADGKGRGKAVIGVARSCDLIIIMVDATRPLQFKRKVEYELERFGIRLNRSQPDIVFKKTTRGGISVTMTEDCPHLTDDAIKNALKEFRIINADLLIRQKNCTIEDVIDVVQGQKTKYIPAITVMNKCDSLSVEELDLMDQLPNWVPISVHKKWNLEELRVAIWDRLNLTRVYTKPPGGDPDFDKPMILRVQDPTVEHLCTKIHKDLARQMKYALVYGRSSKFEQGQRVGREHVLRDEDVVSIVTEV